MFKAFLFAVLLFVLSALETRAQLNTIESKKSLGTYQYFQTNGTRLNNKQLLHTLKGNAEAYELMSRAKTNNTVGSIFGFLGGVLIGSQLGTAMGGGEPNWAVAGVGAGLIGVGIPFNTAYNKHSQKAVELYNAGINAPSSRQSELYLGFSGTGLGLQLKF